MPLWKFRSIEEMNASPAETRGDGASRLEALLACLGGIATSPGKRGVQKFRTPEEANEERLNREKERIQSKKEQEPAGDSYSHTLTRIDIEKQLS
jgi:hypothetical protein